MRLNDVQIILTEVIILKLDFYGKDRKFPEKNASQRI